MNQFPKRLLVANRGEIARRILLTARKAGIETVVVHHPVDQDLPFLRRLLNSPEFIRGSYDTSIVATVTSR
ncbi:biotin carboxylase N-terminal domain-containing protein [Saccharopolyspora shandongensis]|uniref:biotin carboxylase N-terminal domain-containing protein n=1 Tax=Saccharopolyspora shandongensis TaxID=418495 RepID=UPI0033D8E074